MQPNAPPMSRYEQNLTQGYQMLDQGRMQKAIMHDSIMFCIDRCLDTEELYTLLRTTHAPIKYRLTKDLEEKKCVTNCGAKWDELYRMSAMNVNESETRKVQNLAMQKMMESMQQ